MPRTDAVTVHELEGLVNSDVIDPTHSKYPLSLTAVTPSALEDYIECLLFLQHFQMLIQSTNH